MKATLRRQKHRGPTGCRTDVGIRRMGTSRERGDGAHGAAPRPAVFQKCSFSEYWNSRPRLPPACVVERPKIELVTLRFGSPGMKLLVRL